MPHYRIKLDSLSFSYDVPANTPLSFMAVFQVGGTTKATHVYGLPPSLVTQTQTVTLTPLSDPKGAQLQLSFIGLDRTTHVNVYAQVADQANQTQNAAFRIDLPNDESSKTTNGVTTDGALTLTWRVQRFGFIRKPTNVASVHRSPLQRQHGTPYSGRPMQKRKAEADSTPSSDTTQQPPVQPFAFPPLQNSTDPLASVPSQPPPTQPVFNPFASQQPPPTQPTFDPFATQQPPPTQPAFDPFATQQPATSSTTPLFDATLLTQTQPPQNPFSISPPAQSSPTASTNRKMRPPKHQRLMRPPLGFNNLRIPVVTKREYKIMFWNIQNIYAYKIMTDEEYQLDQTISGTSLLGVKKSHIAHMASTFTGKDGQPRNRRSWVVEVIRKIDPDIIAIVELSVGKKDIVDKATMGPQDSFPRLDLGGSWAPEQYQISLDWAYGQQGLWHSATSPINSTDITLQVGSNQQVTKVTSKNTMFEMYGLLWKSTKLKVIPGNPIRESWDLGLAHEDSLGSQLKFPERAPAYVKCYNSAPTGSNEYLFSILFIHAVFGQLPKKSDWGPRGEVPKLLSQLNEFSDDRLIIAGDFNLDFQEYNAAYQVLTSQMPSVVNGLTSFSGKEESAYDNIFIKGFDASTAQGGVFKFDEDLFNDKPTALQISDHRPVWASLQVPLKPPAIKRAATKDPQAKKKLKVEHDTSQDTVQNPLLAPTTAAQTPVFQQPFVFTPPPQQPSLNTGQSPYGAPQDSTDMQIDTGSNQ